MKLSARWIWLWSVAACGLAAGPLSGCELDLNNLNNLNDAVTQLADVADDYEARTLLTMVFDRYAPGDTTFERLPPPTTKRTLYSVFSHKGQLFVVGGVDEQGVTVSAVEAYDTQTRGWTQLEDWSVPTLSWWLTVGDALCATAGYEGFEATLSSRFECYDAASDAWTTRAELPATYTSNHPIVVDGKVYLLGGTRLEGTRLEPVSDAWVYDPATDAWSALAPLPEARGLMGVEVIDGQIYLVGGFDDDGLQRRQEDENEDEHGAMLVYDIAADAWSSAPQMPHARALYGTDVIKDHIVVYFGATEGPLVEAYDPQTRTWSQLDDPPELPGSGLYTSVKHGDTLYLMVLIDQLNSSDGLSSGTLWSYEFADNSWQIVATREQTSTDGLIVGESVGEHVYWLGANMQVDISRRQRVAPSARQVVR